MTKKPRKLDLPLNLDERWGKIDGLPKGIDATMGKHDDYVCDNCYEPILQVKNGTPVSDTDLESRLFLHRVSKKCQTAMAAVLPP